jgi:hypothetical protein
MFLVQGFTAIHIASERGQEQVLYVMVAVAAAKVHAGKGVTGVLGIMSRDDDSAINVEKVAEAALVVREIKQSVLLIKTVDGLTPLHIAAAEVGIILCHMFHSEMRM